MKGVASLTTAVALLTIMSCTARVHPAAQTDSLQVHALNATFDEAERKRDLVTIEGLLGDPFVWTTFAGRNYDRQATIAHLRAGDSVYDLYTSDSVVVSVDKMTAIVTGRLRRVGRNSRRDLSGLYRYTRVYSKSTGRWLLVAMHFTEIRD